jgi:hypothetical protein
MSYYTSISLWALESKESTHLLWWNNFGNDIQSIILKIITDPLNTLQVFKTNLLRINSWSTPSSSFPTYVYLVTLLTPLALVPILSPVPLMTVFPYVFWFLISNNPIYWRFRLQYDAPIIPFIFISTIYGVKELSKLNLKLSRKQVHFGFSSNIRPKFLRIIMIIIFFTNLFSMIYPIEGRDNYWFLGERTVGMWTMTLHRQALQEVIDLVPSNASILTHNNIFPHVDHRLQVYPGWRSDLPQCDYILVDTTLYWSFVRPSTIDWKYEATTASKLNEIWSTGNYGLVTAVDGIWLWKKGLSQNVSLKEIVAPGGHGLMASFYNNTQFNSKPVFNSVFLKLGPDLYRFSTDWETVTFPESTSLNMYWQQKIQPHANLPSLFSAKFSGYINIPVEGNYSFQSYGLGNLILSIDNRSLMTHLDYRTNVILLDALENSNEETIVENNMNSWGIFAWEQGNIGMPMINETNDTLKNEVFPTINVEQGNYAHWCIFHVFSQPLNLTDKDYISLWWYGNNTKGRIAVKLNVPDDDNYYYQTFIDSFVGWKKVILPINGFIKVGSAQGWSSIVRILIHSVDENLTGDWRFGHLTAGKGIPQISEADYGTLGNEATIYLTEGFHKFGLFFNTYENECSIWINWLTPWENSFEVLSGEYLYLQPS